MTDKQPFTDHDLDDLFALAKADAPEVSDDLMARIISDAQGVAAEAAKADAPIAPKPQGWFDAVMGMIGGWPAAAGLAAATVAGVMIGAASPETLDVLTASAFADTSVSMFDDILPSYDGFLDEG